VITPSSASTWQISQLAVSLNGFLNIPANDVWVWELSASTVVTSQMSLLLHLVDECNNAPATEYLADQWIMVNKGAQTALSDPALEITSGSIFLDTMEWKNASQLESNAFCGGMGHTTTKDMVMVGGHSQVCMGGGGAGKRGRQAFMVACSCKAHVLGRVGDELGTLLPQMLVTSSADADRHGQRAQADPHVLPRHQHLA
jgi:hypothetical protein